MSVDPRAFKDLSRFLAPSAGGDVADRALGEGRLTQEQLDACVEEQRRTGKSLDQILVDRGHINADDTERLRRPPLPPEAAAIEDQPDRVLGHYVLVDRLGEGGMGEVWRAWDRSIGRWVAIKYLKKDIGRPTQRIEREGRMAGRLSHPNIITIFERGQHEGRPYLVMPYVEGKPAERPMGIREVVRIGTEVALALAHAHAEGIVHRDVKPGNIMVTPEGRIVLTDFGLAVFGDGSGPSWSTSGTPDFASPEQMRGGMIDARSDIYSLGMTLKHLAGGSPTGALGRIIRKATEPEPADRFQSMERFANALQGAGRRPRAASILQPINLAIFVLVGVLSSGLTYHFLSSDREMQVQADVQHAMDMGNSHLALASEEKVRRFAIREASRAIPQFRQAILLSGGFNGEAYVGIGRAYEIMGLDAKAVDAFSQVPGDVQAREGLARIWRRRGLASTEAGLAEDARQAFRMALDVAPEGWKLEADVKRRLKSLGK